MFVNGVLNRTTCLILFFFIAIAAPASADELKLSQEVNASYIAAYVNFVFKPKPVNQKVSPYEARINPEHQYLLTNGLHYSDITVSEDLLKFTINDLNHPFAEFYVIPATKISNFSVKNFNSEFSGSFEVPEMNGSISTKEILNPIASECMDVRINTAKISDNVFTHMDCANRNLQLFITRPSKRATIAQTFNAKISINATEPSKDISRHIIFIKYLEPKLLDFRKPFNSLAKIPLATHAIEYYLNSENTNISLEELLQNLKLAFIKDQELIQESNEDVIISKLLDPEIMPHEFRPSFEALSISHTPSNNSIVLSNLAENYFSGSLTVYSTYDKKIVAASAMVLPILIDGISAEDLAYKIARDIDCKSVEGPKEITNWQMKGFGIKCDKTYSTHKLSKQFLLYLYPNIDPSIDSSEQPVQMVMLIGNAEEQDINDIVFNIELNNGIIWNLNTENLSGYEIKKIFEIPHAFDWFTENGGNTLDLSKSWGKFLARTNEQIAYDKNRSPEHVVMIMKTVSANLSKEIESIKKLEENE